MNPIWLSFALTMAVLAPSLAHAASLENPSGGLFYSGIGVISGWKCEANGELTVRFNGGEPDSPGVRQRAARCARSRRVWTVPMSALWPSTTGRASMMGPTRAVAYDAGVEFARGTFQTTRLVEDKEFVPRVEWPLSGTRLS